MMRRAQPPGNDGGPAVELRWGKVSLIEPRRSIMERQCPSRVINITCACSCLHNITLVDVHTFLGNTRNLCISHKILHAL
ncbi:AAA-type ATPase family protein [Zea mays]|uniref:AAA-type ATPase family protein n=1 Tax=Zea mays TaxID=4577 RepID=A0A1D6PAM4_MAIZE|nr:AAA-type ATPase family protein [Zea mays]